MSLPLAFVSSFGYGTILIAVFVFYVLVSLELLAEEIEDPFGMDDNDLPLNELCAKIKENVEDVLKVWAQLQTPLSTLTLTLTLTITITLTLNSQLK